MGEDGRHHQHQRVDGLIPHRCADHGRLFGLDQRVVQLHQRGDGRVEAEVGEVVGHLDDGLVQLAFQVAHIVGRRLGRGLVRGGVIQRHAPDAVHEAAHALDRGGIPRPALVPRADEHQVAAHGVGAVLVHHFVRVDHVAPALGHLLAVGAQDHALVEQPLHGLVKRHHFQLVQRLGEEARVQQVHGGVLDAARVLVDRQPVVALLLVPRHVVFVDGLALLPVRRHVSVVIPTGAHEGVHGVGLTRGRAAALGARHVQEALVILQRALARGLELRVVGQHHRQVLVWHRHRAAGLAVDDGDGRAPHTLAADQPIAQPVRDRGFTLVVGHQPRNRGLDAFPLALARGHPVQRPGVDHDAFLGPGLFQVVGAADGTVRRLDHQHDRQVELFGELEVALVVRGHGHDGAGAVAHHHVVGNPDGNARFVDRVDRIAAGEDTSLNVGAFEAFELASAAGCLDVGLHGLLLLGRGQGIDQVVLWCQDHERGAPQGVWACGEHRQRTRVGVEIDLGPLGAADPVGLLGDDVVRPVDRVEVEQFVGVVGDAEEPLLHQLLNDGLAGALVDPVYDLLVCQHRLEGRRPVDHGLAAVGDSVFEHLGEQPLGPLVVGRIARDGFTVPVEHRAHRLHLDAHALDVRPCPVGRVNSAGDRRVLGGQAKGVEPHGEQHVVALHAHVARPGVGRCHRIPVTHVQVARGVGKHRERVVLRLVPVDGARVEAVGFPALLPAGLDRPMVIGHDRQG